ncbi:MAG: transcriptional regulator [Armatimonadetes bacterium Cent15-Ar3]|nr:MAG: transcriptional regulator [Armatimonadetes bacterium Cent15-Ar3]
MNLTAEQFTKAMRALSEPNRVEILRRVGANACQQGVTCSSVLDQMGISQSTFSHHVSELKEAGLLIGQAEGRLVRLTVNEELLVQVQNAIANLTTVKN